MTPEIEPLASEQAAEMYFLRRRQTVREQVREFHEAFGLPMRATPGDIPDERITLRLRLITEEYLELLESCGVPLGDDELLGGSLTAHLNRIIRWASVGHMADVADDLADLAYVVEGTNLELGIDSGAVLAEVHRSNMSKLGADGKPVLRADGKVTKGPNYSPPDIAACLRAQGWDGR